MTQSVQTVKFADLSSVASISWGGAFLEWLDFYTYAVYATVVASVFFPSMIQLLLYLLLLLHWQ